MADSRTNPQEPSAGGASAYARAHTAQRRARKRRTAAATRATRPTTPPQRSASQQAGDAAEARALRYLLDQGLTLVTRNFSCKAGEIDLILQHDGVLVFVEVRAREQAAFGGAAASVGHAKRQRLRQAARFFLAYRWPGGMPRCRFDVIALEAGRLHWLRDAFRDTPR